MINAVLALNELDTAVFDSPSLGAAPRIYDDFVTVPDAHLLFNGDFKRVGTSDLKIVGQDGQSFFIADYFAAEKRAHLMSPEGATLSPRIVEALAGPLAPGQSAQAGAQPGTAQPVIGRVDTLTGSATVVRNGVSVTLNVGDTVRKGDVVQTAGGSAIAIVFADGSTFSLNANARMVLDDFVYNASGTGNSALINLVQGTFSFVAGQVAKTGEMRVETPVATMGIRGTAVLVEISANDGQTRFSVMVEPNGTTGSFNLYNKTTGALIATVNNSQVGWVVSPAGPLDVVATQEQKTPAQLQQELGIVQQIFTIFNNNQQNPFVPQQDNQERRGDKPNDTNPQTTQGTGGSGEPLTVTVQIPLPEKTVTTATVTLTPVNDTFSNASNDTPTSTPTAISDASTYPPPGETETSAGAKDDQASIGENESATFDVLANDPGGFAATLTAVHIASIHGPAGVTLGNPTVEIVDNKISLSLGNAFDELTVDETATIRINYTMRDPNGKSSSATAIIAVSGANEAPIVIGPVTGSVFEDGPAMTLDGLANTTDPDRNSLELFVESADLPPSVTYNGETHTFTLDPSHPSYQSLAAGEKLIVQVAYEVSDGTVVVPASVAWTITGINDAPVIMNVVDSGMVTEDSPANTISGSLNGIDVDGGDTVTWSVQAQSGQQQAGVATVQGTYGSLTINQEGQWIYTLNNSLPATQALGAEDHPTELFTIAIFDSQGASDTHTVNVTVNGTDNENSAPVTGDIVLEANVIGNGGFEAVPDFTGWIVDDEPSGLSYIDFSSVTVERSGSIFVGDNAVAVLNFSGEVPVYGSTGIGPSITSYAFVGNVGDTIRFVYQLSSGNFVGSSDRGIVIGRIIDDDTEIPVQTIENSADLGHSTGPITVEVDLQHSGNFKIEFEVRSEDTTFGGVVGARLDLGFAGIIREGVTEDASFTFSQSSFLANATDTEGDALSLNWVGATSELGAQVYFNSDGSVTYDPTTAAAIQALELGEMAIDRISFTIRDEHGAVSNQAFASVTVHGANEFVL